jgi:CheY-like chemotaxis protein
VVIAVNDAAGIDTSTLSLAGHVLVVEDDPHIRQMVADFVADEGHPVAAARHGGVALALIAAGGHPALVLLDMRMEPVDGWAFAAAYRALPGPHAPIVAMTAASDARRWGQEIEADAFLSKPFDLDELLTVVAQFTAGKVAA